MDAMGRGDVDAVVALLAEDAVWSMPPLGSWYRGREAIAVFLATAPLNGRWDWRHLPARASGQAAVGAYVRGAGERGSHRAFALDVLTLRDDRVADGHVVHHAHDVPARRRGLRALAAPRRTTRRALRAYFEAFGLPARLD